MAVVKSQQKTLARLKKQITALRRKEKAVQASLITALEKVRQLTKPQPKKSSASASYLTVARSVRKRAQDKAQLKKKKIAKVIAKLKKKKRK